MSETKYPIYFPSFSSLKGYMKSEREVAPGLLYRFYDDNYPEEYRHKYFLITAGDLYKKLDFREKHFMDNGTLVFGDSGGFQIANGTLDWNEELLHQIFQFLETNSDVAMNLDIPPRMKYLGKFQECLDISVKNFKYFAENQTGKTKFLNVLQNEKDEYGMKEWYDKVKDFEFNGWGVGGTVVTFYNSLYTLALLLQNREFEKKSCQYYHFLGATSLVNFFVYAFMQKNFNKYYPHVQVSTDSSTPIKYAIYGQWIYGMDLTKLIYSWIYMSKKHKYVAGRPLPCTYKDGGCAVCSRIDFDDFINPKTSSELIYQQGYHNTFMFKKIMREVNELAYCNVELLETLIPKDFYKLLKSIDEMFEKPENALRIFEKYKPLYLKYTSLADERVEKDVMEDFFE